MTVPQLMRSSKKIAASMTERAESDALRRRILVQWEFAQMLCGACASAGINVCVESALNCPESICARS